jgi:hypothetical protein
MKMAGEIKTKTLQQAMKMLDALKVQYKIIDEDGNVYDKLIEKKQKSSIPRGDRRSYVLKFIENMDIGDVVEFPAGPYKIEELRSNAISWFNGTHGTGSCTSTVNKEKNTCEILRII